MQPKESCCWHNPMEVNVYVEKVLICELEVVLRTTSALWDREGKTEEKGKTNKLQQRQKHCYFLLNFGQECKVGVCLPVPQGVSFDPSQLNFSSTKISPPTRHLAAFHLHKILP